MALIHVLDIARDVAQVCKKCPNGTLEQAIIRSARKFLRESRWYTTAVPGATTADVPAYSLGSDPYEEIIGLRAMSLTQDNGSTMALHVSDSTLWQANPGTGTPTRYAYVPEGQFVLNVVPDKTYSLTATVILIPKAGQNKIEERVLSKWDQAIQAGALAYLHSLKSEPWYDPNEAVRQERIHQSAINNARADEQRQYQRGSQRARPRGVIF